MMCKHDKLACRAVFTGACLSLSDWKDTIYRNLRYEMKHAYCLVTGLLKTFAPCRAVCVAVE
jgi:hypothetical protein